MPAADKNAKPAVSSPRSKSTKPATKRASSRSATAEPRSGAAAGERGSKKAGATTKAKPRAKRTKSAAEEAPPAAAMSFKFAPSNPEAIRKLAIDAARLVRDDRCENVLLLDVSKLSHVTDYLIIGSGTSERQMRSVLDHVAELGAKSGFTAFRTNIDERSTWLLLDFVDIVVHLFEPNTRAHYDLESLWAEGVAVEWERPDQIPRDRAGLRA